MRSLAVLSLHTSPLAQPGTGDSGGMNVYVRELVSALAQAGVRSDVYVRRWRDDLPDVVEVEPGFRVVHVARRPGRPGQGEPARGRRRVHRRGWAATSARQGEHRRHPRQLLAVGPGRPPAQARAVAPAGLDLPHPGPGQGRDRRPRARPAGRRRDRGHRLLRRHPGLVPSRGHQLVELYGADPQRIEIVPPGVDHAFFSPGDRRGARAGPRPGRTTRCCCSSVASSRSRGSTSPSARWPSSRARTPTPCWSSSVAPAALDGSEEMARGPGARRHARPAGPGALRPAPAPPPAVDLLPGRRRVHRAEPVGVVRAGGARGRRLRHAGGGRRRRRAAHPGRRRRHRLPRRQPRPGRLRRGASPRLLDDPAWPPRWPSRPPSGPGATPGRPPRPGCAASTPTSPSGARSCRCS